MENENKEPTPKGEEGEDNNSTQNTPENLRIDPDESRKQAIMSEKNGDFSNAAAFYALIGDKEKVLEMIDKVEELKNKETENQGEQKDDEAEAEPEDQKTDPENLRVDDEQVKKDAGIVEEDKVENQETDLDLEGLKERMKSERNAFIDIGKECKSKIEEGLKGRKLKKLRKDIDSLKALAEQHGANINPNDSKWMISGNTEEMEGAERRKKNYISELMSAGKINKEQAELIYRTECQKEVYKQAKKEYGKNKMEKRVEELVQGGEKIEVAKQKVRAELFDELIVKESETIRKAELEHLPPEEKRFYNKVFSWYLRQNTATRLLISTGVVTGAVAFSGGFGTSSLAMFAGYRFLRGATAVLTGKLASAGVGWAMERRTTKKRGEREEEMKKTINFDDLGEIEKRYNEHLQEKKREDRRTLIAKATAGIVAGAGTAIGAGMLENAYLGGGGGGGDVEKTPEAEKGGMIADHEEAEKAVEKETETVKAEPKEITLETKQNFYGKFVEKFGAHGEYGLSSNQIAQQLLEGKVSPEDYYDFVKENAGEGFNVDKQSFVEKLERQIENYSNAEKMTGVEQDVAMRASLQVLHKTIDQSISYFNFVEQVEQVGSTPVVVEIGARGPQGSVIDSFRGDYDLARKFGAPENLFNEQGEVVDKTAFDNWAGRKAHLLWLESAKEALKNEEVLNKMGELGYSKDIEGYGQMMRHIGEGNVVLDPEKGVMFIGEETDYLKSSPVSTPTPEAEPEPVASEQTTSTPEVKEVGGDIEQARKAFYEKFSERFQESNPVESITKGEVSPEQYYNFFEEQYSGELPEKQTSIKEMESILNLRTEAVNNMSGDELNDFLERSDRLIEERINEHIELLGEKESLSEISVDTSSLEMERDVMESTGFTREELDVMKKNVDVGYLMNEIPEDVVHKATLIQRNELEGSIAELMDGKRLPVPPEGADEEYAMKQIELARILHELNPDQQEKHMKIGEFIKDKNEFWKHLKRTDTI